MVFRKKVLAKCNNQFTLKSNISNQLINYCNLPQQSFPIWVCNMYFAAQNKTLFNTYLSNLILCKDRSSKQYLKSDVKTFLFVECKMLVNVGTKFKFLLIFILIKRQVCNRNWVIYGCYCKNRIAKDIFVIFKIWCFSKIFDFSISLVLRFCDNMILSKKFVFWFFST